MEPTAELQAEQPPLKAAEYTGEVTGEGIKMVMANPKTPIELIPPRMIEAVAEVLQHGAKKYNRNNWMAGMSWSTVYGGVQRHLNAFYAGEEIDPESGLPHLSHAACGIMFLLWYSTGPQRHEHRAACDDRAFKTCAEAYTP